MSQIHFISGLPRSGSTLLAAILRQNPKFHASITSPVAQMFAALQNQMSEQAEGSVFVNDGVKEGMLECLVRNYYTMTLPIPPHEIIFDTNRLWTAKLDVLFRLFPQSKMIVMLRSPAWIIDSIERLVRRNALVPSRMFGCNPNTNVYARVAQLMGQGGMVSSAYNNTREAFWSQHNERLLFVRYESLTQKPAEVLNDIIEFCGEPIDYDWFEKWLEHNKPLQQIPLAAEFDAKLGMPGLHTIGSRIEYRERETILPPDIFQSNDAPMIFWNDPKLNTKGMKVI